MAYTKKYNCKVFGFYLLPSDLMLHVIWQLFMFLAPFSDIDPFQGSPVKCLKVVIQRLRSTYFTYRDILTYIIGTANSVAGFMGNIYDGSGGFDKRFLNKNRYVLEYATEAFRKSGAASRPCVR